MTAPMPTENDLKAALGNMPPGRYRTADLLTRYTAWAEREGKPVPTAQRLGMAIARELCLDSDRGHGNVTVWIVNQAGLDCRNWFRPTS